MFSILKIEIYLQQTILPITGIYILPLTGVRDESGGAFRPSVRPRRFPFLYFLKVGVDCHLVTFHLVTSLLDALEGILLAASICISNTHCEAQYLFIYLFIQSFIERRLQVDQQPFTCIKDRECQCDGRTVWPKTL